ncbi:hypothetical protein E4188_17200 [Aeromonas media]|uniref:Phage tail protein n=1 Tax=Aeromonas media TaxID=651 RepID=A0ABX6NW38_AERME|nr:hypothetical protein [Aeromonas media]MBP8223579.1 hypothetical protein [Aeromonas sp.]QJT34480.1 hypothetical protein E4187_09045 [Aeromonas media]QJT40056.1 hypothetical protein E4188_17200 [Aeromonas media]
MIMTGLDPAIVAALNRPNVTAFYATKIDLPSGITRLHTGLGEAVIGGEVYYGIGAMGQISPQKEQLTTSPTQLNMTLTGLDNSLLAEVMKERLVGRLVWLYLVVLDDTGALVAAALQYKGRIASTPVKVGRTNTVQLTISNIFEDWKKGLSMRCTDESHRRLFPNDAFFRLQTWMANCTIFWGSAKDGPDSTYKD